MIANFLLDSRKGGPHFVLEFVNKNIKNFKKENIYLDKRKNFFFNLKKICKIFFLIDIILNAWIIFFHFKKYNTFFTYGVYNLAPILSGLLLNKKIYWFILENPNFLGKMTIKVFNYFFNVKFIFISKNVPINFKIKNYKIFIPNIDLNFWKNKKKKIKIL